MKRLFTLTALGALLPGIAFAHTGHPEGSTFVSGFMHPIGGFDHLLAMVTVGLWAAVAGGRAMWAYPLAFVAALAVGGGFGMYGVPMPAVEAMILASIVAFGALAALAVKAPVWIGCAVIAVFGLAHGHAHGAEGPATGLALYAVGFLLASAMLHGAGLAFGLSVARIMPRIAGGAAALAGLGLAFS